MSPINAVFQLSTSGTGESRRTRTHEDLTNTVVELLNT